MSEENKDSVPSSPPLQKKGSYDIDFDALDDSVNPFAPKVKLGSSPPIRAGNLMIDENVDPFKPKKKLVNSPPRSPITAPESFSSLGTDLDRSVALSENGRSEDTDGGNNHLDSSVNIKESHSGSESIPKPKKVIKKPKMQSKLKPPKSIKSPQIVSDEIQVSDSSFEVENKPLAESSPMPSKISPKKYQSELSNDIETTYHKNLTQETNLGTEHHFDEHDNLDGELANEGFAPLGEVFDNDLASSNSAFQKEESVFKRRDEASFSDSFSSEDKSNIDSNGAQEEDKSNIDSNGAQEEDKSNIDSNGAQEEDKSNIDSNGAQEEDKSNIDSNGAQEEDKSNIDSNGAQEEDKSNIDSNGAQEEDKSNIDSNGAQEEDKSNIDSNDTQEEDKSNIDSNGAQEEDKSNIDSNDTQEEDKSNIDSNGAQEEDKSNIDSNGAQEEDKSNIDSNDTQEEDKSNIDSNGAQEEDKSNIDSNGTQEEDKSNIGSNVEKSLMCPFITSRNWASSDHRCSQNAGMVEKKKEEEYCFNCEKKIDNKEYQAVNIYPSSPGANCLDWGKCQQLDSS
ncbi:transforming acidic coiled-coil-containing protein 1 [Biomphalaria glabrata]